MLRLFSCEWPYSQGSIDLCYNQKQVLCYFLQFIANAKPAALPEDTTHHSLGDQSPYGPIYYVQPAVITAIMLTQLKKTRVQHRSCFPRSSGSCAGNNVATPAAQRGKHHWSLPYSASAVSCFYATFVKYCSVKMLLFIVPSNRPGTVCQLSQGWTLKPGYFRHKNKHMFPSNPCQMSSPCQSM